jgi:hypothetical protein
MRKKTLLVLLGLGVLSVVAIGPAHADSAGQEVGYGAGSVFDGQAVCPRASC